MEAGFVAMRGVRDVFRGSIRDVVCTVSATYEGSGGSGWRTDAHANRAESLPRLMVLRFRCAGMSTVKWQVDRQLRRMAVTMTTAAGQIAASSCGGGGGGDDDDDDDGLTNDHAWR